jgi:hypothetical protein
MKKISIVFGLALTMFLVNCSARQVLLSPAKENRTYDYTSCGISFVVPANWKLETTPLLELHVVKGNIDIVIDPVAEEMDPDKIWVKVKDDLSDAAGKPLKLSRTEKGKKVAGLPSGTIYSMTEDKQISVDGDVVQCPANGKSIILYSISPVKTYGTDRPEVVKLVNSIKQLK